MKSIPKTEGQVKPWPYSRLRFIPIRRPGRAPRYLALAAVKAAPQPRPLSPAPIVWNVGDQVRGTLEVMTTWKL